MNQRRILILPIAALFLFACQGLVPAATLPAASPPGAVEQTQVPMETEIVPPSSTDVPSPTIVPTPDRHFGQIARAHIEALTAIGARYPGTENERAAAQYIMDEFTRMGYSPQKKIFAAWDENDYEFQSANVWAVKQGSSAKEIIIGAHYDSGNESLGADDNASGVAVMLEVAEQIAKLPTPYTIRFIAFGSEENDLDGSYFYVARMKPEEVNNTLAMVNLDTLASGDITYVYSDEGEKAFLRDWVLEWAGKNNVPLETIPNVDLTDNGDYVADYGAFKDAGIPFIYFEATNWNLGNKDGWMQVDAQFGDEGYIWHTQYDNLAYIDATFPGRVNEHMRIFVSALFAVCTQFQQ